jgi:hypothetical protein
MASPEQPNLNMAPSLIHAELHAALIDVERQLELADANENQIERFFKREELLELQEWLAAEIALVVSSETLLK